MMIGRRGRALKRVLRKVYPVKVPQPRWEQLLGKDFDSWKSLASLGSQTGPQILLVPSNGHPAITTMDSLLAVALTLRGAQVHILLCDESLPACQNSRLDAFPDEWASNEFVRYGPKRDLCPSCFSPAYAMFKSLGLVVHRYSQFLSDEETQLARHISDSVPRDEVRHYSVSGIPVGEHAFAGAIRFFAREALEREPDGEEVLRRYFNASLLTMYASTKLFDEFKYSCISLHHGIYVPQGIIGAVARHNGVRVVAWCQAYRKNSFIFSHGDTYHHTLMSEPVSNWIDLEWDDKKESELLEYLKSRWGGAEDWISFSRKLKDNHSSVWEELRIDLSKPCIGLLTSVVWDAQLHYPQNVFSNMLEWLMTTIRYFANRPDLQLIIRVHPAEVSGQIRSRQPIVEEVKREFPKLPGNIFIIPPNSTIDTYAVMMECDSVLIYATKTGVELTSFGIPVIVAGEAWIRNKGITLDARSCEHYLELLNRLPLGCRLNEETVNRARKYAYHFFFRRMIPLNVVSQANGNDWCPYGVRIDGLDDLLPGKDPGLDVICESIIQGNEFIYPAEHIRNS